MRKRIIALLIAFILMFIQLSCLSSVSGLESGWPIGDEWLYEYSDSSSDVNYSGNMRYVCTNATFWTSRGLSTAVVEFKSYMIGNVTGSLPGKLISGVFYENSTEYYDLDTGATVAFIFEQQVKIIEEVGYHFNYWNYSEYNVTEYLPPGGLGLEPAVIDVGTVWHKNFTQYSHSQGSIDGVDFVEHTNYTEHVKFTFLGFDTMAVPAGSFDTSILQGDYDDGTISTEWYSDEVKNYVRIFNSYPEGDVLELSLIEYTPYSGTYGGTFIIPWYSYIFFAFLGATFVAAIASEIIIRNRKMISKQ